MTKKEKALSIVEQLEDLTSSVVWLATTSDGTDVELAIQKLKLAISTLPNDCDILCWYDFKKDNYKVLEAMRDGAGYRENSIMANAKYYVRTIQRGHDIITLFDEVEQKSESYDITCHSWFC